MTRPQDDDVQFSETASAEGEAQTDSQPADMDGNAEAGEHGRPSDDSDPGHS
ncbi:hypothetical protein [Deinococcus aestuarii]|uniref:hypothetical protein n=1 Tax=Deinococcus aestuarii TaxID=2774531 RepID=UPI001C0C0AC1|nr:hypothetical protein [Deinococcus aestuarii]